MKKISLTVIVLMYVLGVTYTHAQTAPSGGVPMGMNLSFIADWNAQLESADVMKKSREWTVGTDSTWSTGASIPLNANGYPLSVPYKGNFVKTMINVDIGGKYPAGQYTLKITGTGRVETGWDAQSQTFTGPGTYKVRVNPSNAGIYVAIRESSAANPITEINFIAPGYENTYKTRPFFQPFLDRLQGIKVIRFMDPMSTNNSPVRTWADRTPYTYYTQARLQGLAPEYIADLSNTLNTDAWINIPHQADDHYIRQLATLLRDRLKSGLKLYLEYSNENCWNSLFSQSAYCQQQGTALFSADAGSLGQCLKYHARRSGHIFKMFEEVFGGTSRLVRIIAGQADNPWLNQYLLDSLNDPRVNTSGKKADALAIAPYIGGGVADTIGDAGRITSVTVDEILNMVDADVDGYFVPLVNENKTLANRYGVRLLTYEGGQHLVSNSYRENQTLTEKLTAANRHPRMKDIYLRMFDRWRAINNDVFAVYSYVSVWGKYGSWGVLEWQEQDPTTAPKYLAVRQAMGSVSPPP